MPPVYTAPTTNTTLTPEEEAALAAEAAAAAPPPEQTTMYQPSSPPPAEPVAAPPVEQTTMYQPSSPAPAAAPAGYATEPVGDNASTYMADAPSTSSYNYVDPAATSPAYVPAEPEPYTSISPQVTQTGNTRTLPGMTATPSDFYDDAAQMPGAGGGRAWNSISPQDSGNAAKSAYPVSVSDFRDPIKTPEAQAAQSTLYSPADPNRENTQSFRDSFQDNLGRSLALNPNDPKQDMYNQAWNAVSGAVGAGAGGLARDQLSWQKNRLGDFLKGGGGLLGEQARWQVDRANEVVRAGDDAWRATEDVIGPAGNTLRQLQSTANPAGQGFAERIVDPLGNAKDNAVDNLGLNEKSDQLADFFNRGGDRSERVASGEDAAGDVLTDVLNFPLPSFGQEAPKSREIDLSHPEPSWLLTPGTVARQAGFQLGQEGQRIARESAAQQAQNVPTSLPSAPQFTLPSTAGWEAEARDRANAVTGAAQQTAQQARGAALGSRMGGGSNLDAALAAATAVGVPQVNLPSVSLADYIPERESVPYDPLSSAYVPREPARGGTTGTVQTAQPEGEAVTPGKIQGRTLTGQELAARNPDAQLAGSTGNVRTSGAGQNEGPSLMDRLRGVLPGGDDAAPVPYDPLSSAYVPREPNAATADPTVLQRARDAATAAKNWVSGIDMPDINLPGRGGEPTAPTNPLTVRRTGPEGIDPNALYMPEAPPPSLMDRVKGAGSTVVQGIGGRIPDVNMPDVNLPDVSLPDISLPGRGGTPIDAGQRWAPAGTAAPVMAPTADIATRVPRFTTVPDGMTASQETGPDGSQHTWVLNANNEYTGVVDPNTGEYVMFPEGATDDELKALVDSVLGAPTAQSSAPGPATAAPATTGTSTTSTATGSGTTTGTTTTRSSGNGGGGGSTGSGSSGGRTTRSSGSNTSYGDDDYDAPLKMEDFIQDFDGDGTIGKRDRMQGKQAFEQAKMARSKKRRGKTTTRKTNTGFPFDRPDSAIRTKVLGAIAESQGKKG